ncbi:hypothetical protein P3M90_002446 [Salmonella enterica]|uniref:Uncharacterized protein n=1 Tax=Salmonella houtenae TaxID=59205 RepID=A0A702LT70_SALHO|nr:hypothetical protein [Salmonella enterica]ECC1596940.1 hypothetical protein [Salmonella enterica subsp. houtenae]EDV4888009.1 hypothetical protein [Salmonella enterica subsp. enterica]EEH1859524.1 hypothetical protein [Salmonella enterica subsp. houtenae serovar 50:g,z51:-]HAE7576511.1 hypothetical protein [Salmonella enterica subsp. houtenae serovar 48:g,z51:-]
MPVSLYYDASTQSARDITMTGKRIIIALDGAELEIIENFKSHFKNKNGVSLSRTAIIKMLINKLSKEVN